MKKHIASLFITLLIIVNGVSGQSLEEVLNRKLEEKSGPEYILATFKTGRIINGHSIENPEQGDLKSRRINCPPGVSETKIDAQSA